jgi:hypothetical protein
MRRRDEWWITRTFPPDAVPGHRNSHARGCVDDDITAAGQGRSRAFQNDPRPAAGMALRGSFSSRIAAS